TPEVGFFAGAASAPARALLIAAARQNPTGVAKNRSGTNALGNRKKRKGVGSRFRTPLFGIQLPPLPLPIPPQNQYRVAIIQRLLFSPTEQTDVGLGEPLSTGLTRGLDRRNRNDRSTARPGPGARAQLPGDVLGQQGDGEQPRDRAQPAVAIEAAQVRVG